MVGRSRRAITSTRIWRISGWMSDASLHDAALTIQIVQGQVVTQIPRSGDTAWNYSSIRVIVLEALCNVEETRKHTDDEYPIRSEEQIIRHLTYRLRYTICRPSKKAPLPLFCCHHQRFRSAVQFYGVA